MKATKKNLPAETLDDVIGGGAASLEEERPKKRRGRREGKVKKEQKSFHLPLDINEAIEVNCLGNQSALVEKILREYFEKNGMINKK